MGKIIVILKLNLLMFSCSTASSSGYFKPNEIQIIDSVQYSENEFIYWYRVDLGINDYSICKLCLATNSWRISEECDFFVSDHIADFEINAENQIYIQLHRDSYRIIENPRNSDLEIETRLGGNIRQTYRYRLDTTLIPPPLSN